MERCDCEIFQCLADCGELPHDQVCVEGRPNYHPSMDGEIRLKQPCAFQSHLIETDAKGG